MWLNKIYRWVRPSKEEKPPAPTVDDNLTPSLQQQKSSETPQSISELLAARKLTMEIPPIVCWSFIHSEIYPILKDYILTKIETIKLRLLEARQEEISELQVEARTLFSVLTHINTQAQFYKAHLDAEKLKQMGLEPKERLERNVPDSLQ